MYLGQELFRRKRSGELRFKVSMGNSSVRPYLKEPFTKIGLVEWLKVKALSSGPSISKKEKNVFGSIDVL
jgi:hypothetical protein